LPKRQRPEEKSLKTRNRKWGPGPEREGPRCSRWKSPRRGTRRSEKGRTSSERGWARAEKEPTLLILTRRGKGYPNGKNRSIALTDEGRRLRRRKSISEQSGNENFLGKGGNGVVGGDTKSDEFIDVRDCEGA